MSESVSHSFAEDVPARDPAAQLSGGARLRKAREAQGLHIAALAVSLKVPVKKLEALETDRFDLLPDMVFVRALASSVCRTLKIDPEPVLENLPQITAPSLKAGEAGINVPFRASQDGVPPSISDQFSRPLVLAILLLLFGVLAIAVFPFSQTTTVIGAPMRESSVEAPRQQISVPYANEAAVSAPTPSMDLAGIDSSMPIKLTPMASSASTPVGMPKVVSETVSGTGLTSGVVVFTARGPSWVEVVDAGGVVQIRKTMASGEVVGASGALPLSVVVGRVANTDVHIRGKALDLTSLAKDNVARFEVR